MKRFIALILIALLSIAAATAATIAPLPAAAPDLQNGAFAVEFNARDITEKTIPVTIYDYVLYDAAAIEALQPGDVIVCGDEEITVKTIDHVNGFIDINGTIDDDYTGGGLSLIRDELSGDAYRTLEMDGDGMRTEVLATELPLADEVTYRHFGFDLWQGLREEYDSATVPADYLKNAILEAMLRFERMIDTIDFNDIDAPQDTSYIDAEYLANRFVNYPDATTLTLKDGRVAEITVDYRP